MGLHEYEAVQAVLAQWRRALDDDRVERGLALASEVQYDLSDAAGRTVAAVRDLLLSLPDVRYDEDEVITDVRELNARTQVMYPNESMRELAEAVERNAVTWAQVRTRRDEALARADEWSLVATIVRRDRTAVDAETLAEVLEAYVDLVRRTASKAAHRRLARVGAEAFGVRFLADAVLTVYTSGLSDESVLRAADAAYDELAALAASTDPDHLAPAGDEDAVAVAARRALIALAGHPELTADALARIPQYRLDEDDLASLQRLVADRADVFDESFTDDLEQARSVAGELALMRALDAAGSRRDNAR